MADAGEPLKYQTWVLKVSFHCEGCKKKVKKIIHGMKDIYTVEVDLQQNKVTVVGNVDSDNLIKRLHKYGKRAELLTPIPTEMDKKQPAATQLWAQVPPGVERKQQAPADLSPQIPAGLATKQPAPLATVLPQTQESTSLEKNIDVSATVGKLSATSFPVPLKKHPDEKKNEATAQTKNGPEQKLNVDNESSMKEAATRPGNPTVVPSGVIAGYNERKGKQPAGAAPAAAADQAKMKEVNKGEPKRSFGEETSKAAKVYFGVTAGDAASPAKSCDYPAHLHAHQPIYTMSHLMAQPSSSYPVNYTLPSASTYAYAYGYAPPEQVATSPPLETYSGSGTPTYYMFNDENANSCSLM